MKKLFDVIEDANAPYKVNASHENGNFKKIGIETITKNEVKTPSNVKLTTNSYTILTDEPFTEEYVKDGKTLKRDSSMLYKGLEGYVKYYDDNKNTTLRQDHKFNVVNVSKFDGKMKIVVFSKFDIQKTDNQEIELNFKKVDSQDDNRNYPGEIFVSNVEEGSVKIQFTNKALSANGYYIAYRKADDANSIWKYAYTDKEEITLTDVEKKDYFVRAMYFGDNDEFSFFSDEVLLSFF